MRLQARWSSGGQASLRRWAGGKARSRGGFAGSGQKPLQGPRLQGAGQVTGDQLGSCRH